MVVRRGSPSPSNVSDLSVVSELLHVPPTSSPRPTEVYLMLMISPSASLPFFTEKLAKPSLVNQSLSVPIQPDCWPPVNSARL